MLVPCFSGSHFVHSTTDVDECSRGIHGCDHTCENTPGSYICHCNSGFSLSSDDGRTCIGKQLVSTKIIRFSCVYFQT